MIIYKDTCYFRLYAFLHKWRNGKVPIQNISVCKLFWYPFFCLLAILVYVLLEFILDIFAFICGYRFSNKTRQYEKMKTKIDPPLVIMILMLGLMIYIARSDIKNATMFLWDNLLYIIGGIITFGILILIIVILYKLFTSDVITKISVILRDKLCPVIEFKNRELKQ